MVAISQTTFCLLEKGITILQKSASASASGDDLIVAEPVPSHYLNPYWTSFTTPYIIASLGCNELIRSISRMVKLSTYIRQNQEHTSNIVVGFDGEPAKAFHLLQQGKHNLNGQCLEQWQQLKWHYPNSYAIFLQSCASAKLGGITAMSHDGSHRCILHTKGQ